VEQRSGSREVVAVLDERVRPVVRSSTGVFSD
jgi:hypothetical protein